MFLLSTGAGKASSLALPIYLIFLLATIAGGIYMLIYRRNINKALKENNGRHVSLPDVRSVIIFILVVVLFYGVFSTKSLLKSVNEEMEFMHAELKYENQCLEQDIEALRDKLFEIEDSKKLVDGFWYYVDSYDIENRTITYTIEVQLKTYTDQTEVSVKVSDQVIELTKAANGNYVGKTTVNMFNNYNGIAEVSITEGETIIIEESDYMALSLGVRDILPQLEITTISNYEYDEDDKRLTIDPYIIMKVWPKVGGTFTDIYFEIDMKGQDVKKVEYISNANLLENTYEVDIDNYFPEVYPGSKMDVYIVGVDSLGFTHKYLIVSWNEGDLSHYDSHVDIYDKEGNKLTEN